MRGTQRGFTLVEILIALAIAAILASFALPSFYGQLLKARRADAVVSLSQIQQEQERWRANNTSYATLSELGLPAQSTGGYYDLTITDATASGFTAQAIAAVDSGQNSDAGCATLTVTVTNGSAANTPTDCWSK